MAKGNHGNYLQHSVEIAAADRLAAENPDGIRLPGCGTGFAQ